MDIRKVMELQSFNFEDFKPQIYNIVKEVVDEVIKEKNKSDKEISNYELLERILKVEEELKHQRELIFAFMKQIDKRFEELRDDMNKRFEQVDKRFEQIDKRFEQIDRRFEQIDRRFEQITLRIDRFMFWSLGLVVSSTVLIIGYMHYFLK